MSPPRSRPCPTRCRRGTTPRPTATSSSASSAAPWGPLTRDPARAALFVDFDGTLAPIVDDPSTATPLPAAVAALVSLSARLGLVAVVSGRPVDYVRRHVPEPAVVVVGQYGLELDRDGTVVADPRAAAYEGAVAAAAAEAEHRWPTLSVERKGRVACTVHWRTDPVHAPTDADLAGLAAAHGLARFPGRLACELRPALPVDKGTAVAGLLAGSDLVAAAFAGDDHGDLAAFGALTEWARAGRDRAVLRVAVASEESPADLLAAADLVVDGPVALVGALGALAAAVANA